MTGRIAAMLLRYLYLYRRSAARVMGVVFWPVMDLLVWGFLTSYLEKAAVPQPVLFLLGAVIFWDVFYSSAQAMTLSITEDIWGRNILNVFVSPIRVSERTRRPVCSAALKRRFVSGPVVSAASAAS